MTSRVISVGAEETVRTAARSLKQWNLGALPVCDSRGELRGVVTDRDIVLRCVALGEDAERTRVSEIMSRRVQTVEAGASVAEAAGIMARDRVRRLPVTDGGRLVGMLSLCDLAREESCAEACAETVRSLSAAVHRAAPTM